MTHCSLNHGETRPQRGSKQSNQPAQLRDCKPSNCRVGCRQRSDGLSKSMLHRPLSVSLTETVHTTKLLPKRRLSTIEHQTWRALGSKEVPTIWVALQSTVLRALKALIRFSSPVNKLSRACCVTPNPAALRQAVRSLEPSVRSKP